MINHSVAEPHHFDTTGGKKDVAPTPKIHIFSAKLDKQKHFYMQV
jgi:hypothetical protein